MPNKVRVIWRSSRGSRYGKQALDHIQALTGLYWAKPEVVSQTTRWKKAQTAIRLIKRAGAAPGGTLLIYRDPRSIRTSRSAYKRMLQEMGISRPIPAQSRIQQETSEALDRLARELELRGSPPTRRTGIRPFQFSTPTPSGNWFQAAEVSAPTPDPSPLLPPNWREAVRAARWEDSEGNG